jgi:hypothetical protein
MFIVLLTQPQSVTFLSSTHQKHLPDPTQSKFLSLKDLKMTSIQSTKRNPSGYKAGICHPHPWFSSIRIAYFYSIETLKKVPE